MCYSLPMKIQSIRITIQDVETTDNIKVVAGFTDVFLDHGEIMLDDENNPKLTEDGLPQPKYEKISATWLMSNNVAFKREIQKMVITMITQHDIDKRKENGETIALPDDLGLGMSKPKKGKNVTKAKKRK